MPHLSPLNWIIMPTAMLLLVYTQMIFIYHFTPSTFPNMKAAPTHFSSWMWT